MDFPADVVRFVERRFRNSDRAAVFEALGASGLTTPRIMRAILWLSDGSMSLFKLMIEQAQQDVREIIMHAEYVTNVSEIPLRVRDFNEPLVDDSPGAERPAQARVARARGPKRSEKSYHALLTNLRFQCGPATYTVAAEQPDPNLVHCWRESAKLCRRTTLPLSFVLEQMAEPVEIFGVA